MATSTNWYPITLYLTKPKPDYTGTQIVTSQHGWDSSSMGKPDGKRRRPVGKVNLLKNATVIASSVVKRRDGVFSRYLRISPTKGFTVDYSIAEHGLAVGPDARQIDLFPRLESQLRSAARGTAVNIGMMLKEYDQTANLFVRTAQDLIRFGRAARRGMRQGPFGDLREWYRYRNREYKKWPKAAAGRWLQFTYGVRPLVNDLAASAEILRKGLQTKPLVLPLNVSTRSFVNELTSRSYNGATSAERLEWSHEAKAWGIVVYQPGDWYKQVSALGLANPFALAWESIPYSFVVDWFITVGETLEDLDNHILFQEIGAVMGLKDDYFKFGRVDLGGTTAYQRVIKSRTAWRGIPFVRPPRWEPSLSASRITSAVSLIIQNLGGKRHR